MRVLVLLALLAASGGLGFGQIDELSSTTDGSALFFLSTFQRTGTDDATARKVFCLDASGELTRVDQRVCDTSYRDGILGPCQFDRLQVSGDSSTYVYTVSGVCYEVSPGSGCAAQSIYLNQCRVATPSGLLTLASFCDLGGMSLSRNGRYAMQSSVAALLDVETQERLFETPFGLSISSNGTVLSILPPASVQLISRSERRVIALGHPGEVKAALASDDLSGFAYLLREGELYWHDLTTGGEVLLSDAMPDLIRSRVPFQVSDDGRLVAHARTVAGVTQVAVSFTATGLVGLRTTVPEGVHAFTLSGDGRTLFVSTHSNRILRIDLGTGASREILPPTRVLARALCPWPDLGGYTIVPCDGQVGTTPSLRPGSLERLESLGVTDATVVSLSAPYPTSLGGVQLLIGGIAAPLRSVSPTSIEFQTPWNVQTGTLEVRLVVENGAAQSPFAHDLVREGESLAAVEAEPRVWLSEETGSPIFVHEDFYSLITDQSPAVAGEIMHVYMTGLGPVSPRSLSNQPAGAQPPSAVVRTLVCRFGSSAAATPAEVVFAGLAPGLIGLYQVDVRVPQSTATLATFACEAR